MVTAAMKLKDTDLAHLSAGGSDPAHLSAGERRYPTSEVSGSGQGCQAATAQEQLRGYPSLRSGVAAGGATRRPRSVAAGRRQPASSSEARGGGPEEPPGARGQGRCPRPGAVVGRSNPRNCGSTGVTGPRGAIPR